MKLKGIKFKIKIKINNGFNIYIIRVKTQQRSKKILKLWICRAKEFRLKNLIDMKSLYS